MAIERKEIKLNITSSDLQLSQEGKYTPSRIISRRYVLKGFGAVVASVMMWNTASAESEEADELNAECNFVLGFKTIRDMIPDKVGDCLENEHHNPENGDALQRTTGGLLVWRKSDNWTAFTDGYRTWVNGPNGLQERLNTERFPWENDPIQEKQTEPEIQYNFPPLPPGAVIQGPDDTENIERIFRSQIEWVYIDYNDGRIHNIRASGELRDWRIEGNRVILNVLTNRETGETHELPLEPRPGYEVSFLSWRGRTVHIVFQSTNPVEMYNAINFYLKKGYPVMVNRRIKGDPLDAQYQDPLQRKIWQGVYFYN